MRLIEIRPKGIYITLEFSSEQLQHILDYLDHSVCEFNSTEEPGMLESDEYVRQELFPQLNELLKEISRGP